ncbi:MAG: hypothetical protein WC264_03425 [Candidatus Paceibacterota bacterium]|jgi:hypothetical protein
MEKELIKAFNNAKYQLDTNLTENIWHTIIKREKHIKRFKLSIFSIIGISSLAGMIPAFNMLLKDFSQSGFYEYVSLLFNGNALSTYWKELTLSLAESLPTINIILSLSLVFVFFLSVRFVAKQIINNKYVGKAYIA